MKGKVNGGVVPSSGTTFDHIDIRFNGMDGNQYTIAVKPSPTEAMRFYRNASRLWTINAT